MRILTFRTERGLRAGAIKGDGVVDLTAALGVAGIQDLLEQGRLEEARRHVAMAAPDHTLDQVKLDLPVPDARKILCVGVNYMDRNAEYQDGSAAPAYPSIFMRTPLSFVPYGEAMLIPPESEQLDYEGEIVLVIGKAGRRIPEARAMDHVAGLTIMNEGSVRDWLRHGKFNVTQGKNFDCSGGLGPWIETDLSAIDVTAMAIETRVNGERRQADSTASLAFPFARLIAYVSTFTTLLPGDLIATGTPTGAGGRFDPPRWLKEGDVVEVEVEGVGLLVNCVRQERTV